MNHHRLGALLAAMALLPSALVATPASATTTYDETKITASDAAANDNFGYSVAASGDTIVVGAYGDNDAGIASGSAYVYQPDGAGGYTETRLSASDVAEGDFFGWSVAVSGDTVVVGARSDDDDGTSSGSAYVYQPDGAGGYSETKLTASDAAVNDFFGHSVAVSGDTIVIGSYQDGDFNPGSAYVYTPDGTGGYTETKLTASDAASSDQYGVSVAVSGDTIVVGAWRDDADSGANAGSAYVYQPDGTGGYTETKLTASDRQFSDEFGTSVAVSGDTVVIGSPRDDDDGVLSGSAYVYTPDGAGGYDETKLTATDAASNDEYGISVAASGDTVVIGAWRDDDGGNQSGSAYVYTPSTPPPTCNGQLVTVDIGAGDTPTAGDDVILGTDGNDVIDAGDGDDTVCGGKGADMIMGGDGDDTIFGDGGRDTITGNDGNDTLHGNAGRDSVFGGSGNDTITGSIGDDTLGGSSGIDTISGDDGDDTINGGSDNDGALSGGDDNDTVNGGGGDDTDIYGDDGNDAVSGNGGNDVVSGGDGDDEVRGGPGDDTVNGDAGDDFVAGNTGVDTCDGGTGNEVAGDTAAPNCETVSNISP